MTGKNHGDQQVVGRLEVLTVVDGAGLSAPCGRQGCPVRATAAALWREVC